MRFVIARMRHPGRIVGVAAVAALAAALWAGTASSAQADYGPLAQYQVAVSGNCDNASLCGFVDPDTGYVPAGGGFWGWAVFNTDGTADSQLSDCFHLVAGKHAYDAPGGGAEAFNADAPQWMISDGTDLAGVDQSLQHPGVLTFWTFNETDTYVGRFARTETFSGWQDTGVPAAPGHYSTAEIMGFSAPGVSFQIQVAQIPNR